MRLPVNHALPLAALAILSGCLTGCGGGGGPRSQPAPIAANGPAADYPVVVGDAFVIDGVTHTPVDKLNFDTVGYASAGAEGGTGVSIAHKTLPLPSYAEVTALESGKTILVRVERRGPMSNERIAELSPGAAAQLGVSVAEKTAIRIRRVNPPEIERAVLRGGGQAPARMDTPPSLLTVLRRKLDPSLAPAALPNPSPSTGGLPPAYPPPATVVSTGPKGGPVPKPTPTPRATPSPRPTPAPQATPVPRPSPSPAPSPVAAASQAPVPGGHFIVQVGTFSVQQNASNAAARVGGQSLGSGRMWRVRIGPFATRAQAAAALGKAKRAGFGDARIERAD